MITLVCGDYEAAHIDHPFMFALDTLYMQDKELFDRAYQRFAEHKDSDKDIVFFCNRGIALTGFRCAIAEGKASEKDFEVKFYGLKGLKIVTFDDCGRSHNWPAEFFDTELAMVSRMVKASFKKVKKP